jgi:cleavage stimulation factor subunit 2
MAQIFHLRQNTLLTTKQQPAPTTYHAPPPANGMSNASLPPQNSSLPPLPVGVDLPAGLSCPDAISRTLNTLPPAQLLDVLSQMKTLASTDPAKATELLHQAPQLSYAIFQALLLMGLVSTEALSSVVEAASAPPPVAAQQYPPPPGNYPPGFPPPPPHMSGQLAMPMGTPPVQGHGLYPPPPPQQRAPAPQPPPQALPDTEALMAQVLAMPQEVIDSLPPADRAQLLALRASYGR